MNSPGTALFVVIGLFQFKILLRWFVNLGFNFEKATQELPCKNLLAIAARSLSKSRSVFGRISRRDRCVIRGAMGAIAARSLSSIA